jgi:hypothetical protein
MTEATWGEAAKAPEINWRMSASLENVPRGETDVAEVTNLERAVRDWLALDPQHQSDATLTTEHAVQIDGFSSTTFPARRLLRWPITCHPSVRSPRSGHGQAQRYIRTGWWLLGR